MSHFKRISVIMSLVMMSLAALTLFLTHAPTARANPGTIYVDASAPGPAHDGSSWTTAYVTLQPALDIAINGNELWVADGVYAPTSGVTRTATLALKSGVALYGGFGGYGISETLRTQRNWTTYKSILSGDLDGNDINTDGNHIDETWNDIQGENAYHVVVGYGVTETAVLDGFTITAGNGTDDDSGGGMDTNGSNPTLANIIFSGNHAGGGGGLANGGSNPTLNNVTFNGNDGGGMQNADSSPTLIDVTFSGNRGDMGGGMNNFNNSNPTLINVTFNGNQVLLWGGGMHNANYSNPTLTNVAFIGNDGDGMYNVNNSNPTLISVTFSNNIGRGMFNIANCSPTLISVTFSSNIGRGMTNNSSNPTLTNVTFSNNGGGMSNSGSSPTLTDVIFSDNRATGSGGGMDNDSSSSPTLTDVTFISNTATGGGGMSNNHNSNPTLNNVTFSDNRATEGDGGGMGNGGSSSPVLNNVTFISNTATNGGGMNNGSSSPVLTNVTFISNTATNKGGGISNDGGSNPILTDVTFSGNQSTVNGGGMWNGDSNPTLTNVTFNDNQTAWNGGGLFNWSSAPTLTNVIFSNNQAAISGGGMADFNNSSSTLITVTFSGNSADSGGGMDNGGNSALTNVTFSSNTATNDGGGMDNAGNPTLTNVTFSGNQASNSGGGMQNDNGSSPTLITVTFSGNRTTDPDSNGGGMANSNSNPTLNNVTFSGNWTAGWAGGGMYNDTSTPTLTDVTFSGNWSVAWAGGGMLNNSSSPTLTNVTFSGNSAKNFGGGLTNYSSHPTLINVLFSGNQTTDSTGSGGALGNNDSHPTLINVTFSGNSAKSYGGGISNDYTSTLTLVNSIVWGNTAITGSQIYNSSGSASIITYSDVQGGYTGAGNLNIDPLFVAPIAATSAPTTTGNYRLQPASYAIDAGNNLSVTVATDLDGQPRIIDGAVDMGTYEAAPRFPEIRINPPTLAMTLTTNDAGLRYLTINNDGLGKLTWSLAEIPSVSWLSATPFTGTQTRSTSKDVAINFNTAGLPVGTYTTTLRVTSNDSGHAQIDVPVTLVVNTLCAPVSAIDLTRAPASDVFAGDAVRFTANATGTVPFTYTWTVNAAPTGGNFNTLDQVFASTGAYTVGVTIANTCGQLSASLPVSVQTRSSNQPDLSTSYKRVSLANVESGDTVTYTLVLRNQSAITATARITDPIPAHTTYVASSAHSSDGQPVTFGSGQLTWSGNVISGTPVIIAYAVTVQTAPIGTAIVNTAQLDDSLGHLTMLDAQSTYNPGFSLSIDDGALYTNLPTVSLSLTWDAAANIDSMKISNDGGFGAGSNTTVWLPLTSTYESWILPASGNQRLPYTVYTKFRDANGVQFGPVQDDIIYDPIVPSTPTIQIIVSPTVHSVATLNTDSVIVRVAATDDNSGVGTIQISNTPDFTQVSEYAATGPTTDIAWTLQSSGNVYVRVVDRAGNVSAEKSATKYFVYLPLVLKKP